MRQKQIEIQEQTKWVLGISRTGCTNNIPYTAFCIDHTKAKTIPTDHPIEEELIHPPVDNSYSNRETDYDHYNFLHKNKDGEDDQYVAPV